MATSGEVVTFAEYEARSNRLAHLFRDLGLRRGDHVAQFMENNSRYLEVEGAAERSGLYYTCINSYLTAEELAYIVNDCQARVLVTSAAKRDVALAAAADCPGVELFLMVGTTVGRLLKLPQEVRDRYDVSSLEVIIHAAAPCPVPVKEQMIEWLGPILVEYYAATEGQGATFCDSEEWLAHRGTVGKPVLGELLILDDDGRPCPTGTPGTIYFRGATSFAYFNDPEKTA